MLSDQFANLVLVLADKAGPAVKEFFGVGNLCKGGFLIQQKLCLET